MANKIQLRRGTKAQLTALGALYAGEPGYTTDTRELVIGNGTGANTPVVTATSADVTYYVRTDGSDANTGLVNTAGGAYKTITKAISMVPQIDNHQVTINVAAGTYAEDVVISDFTGRLTLQAGNTAIGQTNVQSISFQRCTGRFEAYGFTGTSTAASVFNAVYSQRVIFTICWVSAATSAQSAVEYTFSSGRVQGGAYSNRANGIVAAFSSDIMLVDSTGSGNVTGIISLQGSTIAVTGTLFPTGTTPQFAGSGAFITTTSGIINPWGDNTTVQRSTIFAYRGGALPLSANVWTTLIMDGEITDNLSEFDPVTGIFTAKKAGWYSVYLRAVLASFPNGGTVFLRTLRNGTDDYRLDTRINNAGAAAETMAHGSSLIYLDAGGTLSPQITTTVYSNIQTGIAFTRIEIIRAS